MAMNATRAAQAHLVGFGCLIGIAVLCVLWEWQLAPIREGGSWLVLKALPLLFPIYKIWQKPETRRYTYQWSTLLIWLYFTEGTVRAWSDIGDFSQALALIEATLCVVFLVAAIIYIRNTPSHLANVKNL
jgi:uncharacterized membrane protein